ncbi:MAG: cadmium-translocating P-type ATPase [Clostridia bacterium]|nr:cadmium-translocating P-type ATPase [Clostridia bacterium]
MSRKQKKILSRIIVSIILLVAFAFIPLDGYIKLACYLAVYFIIGYDILIKAFRGIINGRVFDENFLMAVATIGAFALAIYEKSGDYLEAISVMLFYQIGEFFQSYAVGKSRKSIIALMDIRPDYANVEVDGKLEAVNPEDVEIGTVITVNPGEKIPIDGIVEQGDSVIDTSALTGESVPRNIGAGDEVLSGCVNMNGVLKIRTSKAFGESTVSKILELTENASSRKSKSEKFISKFSRIYTPVVCASALLLAVAVPLFRLFVSGVNPSWHIWIYRALTFLVISCPCALVISIPLSFFAGIGGASREGILIKGSNFLETLSKAKTIIFDKTGTLTEGRFEIDSVHHGRYDDRRLIELAALAESASSHPISISLKNAYAKEIDLGRVSDIKEFSGKGVIALVDGIEVAVGNEKLMNDLQVEYMPCHSAGTIVHLCVNGEYSGHIVIKDVIKQNSKSAIEALKKSGIRKTVMLTGDSSNVAENVSAQLGIDEVHSQLMPDDKVRIVERIINDSEGKEKTAFVGDGINDAPSLVRADIGIAMGAMGSDAAIEAADVVLMDDDPKKISTAVRISKKCLGIVYQNIVFSIGIKVICLILGALGIANMWLAIFADVGVMIIAALNAIRVLHIKKEK